MTDTAENFDHIDPKLFFEGQMRLARAEHRKGLTWGQWCEAVKGVLRTESGQRMLEGLKVLVGFDQARFWDGDDYNTHAAAKRDGACETVQRLMEADQWQEAKR